MFGKNNINVELPGGIKINNVATMLGLLLGDEWEVIGRAIDEATKDVTIKFEQSSDDEGIVGIFKKE